MSFGRPYILQTDGCIHDGWLVIGDIENIFEQDYLYYALSSNFMYQSLSLKAVGSTVKNLKADSVKTVLFPIPPINEQNRIAKYAEKIALRIESITDSKEELIEIVNITKSKILDLAIRGKLVPQDPNDEPASVLLERIRAEKEELIKQGKIKRNKKESIIFRGDDNSYYERFPNGDTICIKDEIPFNLPESWEWCRLQNITSILTDGTHKTPTYSNEGYIFLSSKNVANGYIDWDNAMYISDILHQELYSRLSPQVNDILLAKNGTTGVAAIVDRNCIFDIYVSLALIRIVNNIILPQYILRVIESHCVQKYFKRSLKGIGVPNLHLEQIRKTLIPIPPYQEQLRIMEKINIFLNKLDEIEVSLN